MAKCQLSEWDLPPLIVSWFRKKGISSLFEWQVECLSKDDVLKGGNLVYSAPTSAGKTLVADFLLLKAVLQYGKKALVIEPFVALTREKAATLKSMLYTTKARVGAFGGTYYTPGGMTAVQVAVCTIEWANNFINKLINENKLNDLGIIVVDEIHYLGDEKRGYQLELLLTKVLYHNSFLEQKNRIQIVGLSATIPNLESIAVWLKASLYVTEFRPVPLVEKIKISDNIYQVTEFLSNPSCEPIETIKPGKIVVDKDYDDLCYICIDSIVNGHSTLVFCESKRECEIMASNLADQIKLSGNKLQSPDPVHADISQRLRANLSRAKIVEVLDKLKKCPAGPDKELVKSLSFGVAFHHAGLTNEEREIIEDGFKGGAIKTLMATSTLSSGVNLPARKVIIRSPTMISTGASGVYQKEMLNPITYRQMIGRAGRKGIDTCGESILICRPDNQDIAMKLIKASLGHITSSLAHRMIASEGEPSGLKKAVLEVIANNTAKSKDHLNHYLESTFWLSLTTRKESEIFKQAIAETLRYLINNKFIEELRPGVYKSTRLGNAVLVSGLHPDESLELLHDLIKAREGFCLLNDLHIIYQVTPNDISRTIDLKDWQHYSKIWNNLDEVSLSVGERIGISEITIARRCQGFTCSIGEEKERIYRRFWVALIINDLISEIALSKICSKYRISKATVQQVQRAVAQFAGVLSIFCQELGYDNIAALVKPLESRINFSCQRDLLELIKLNLTRPIARALHNANYKNAIAVAKADKLDIDFVIRQIKPFKKDVSFSGDEQPMMWVPELAKNMTTLDYASHIVDTARSFVEIEYELELGPIINKRKDNQQDKNELNAEEQIEEHKITKRGRLDNGLEFRLNSEADTGESSEMLRANRNLPNFIVQYVGDNARDVDKFLNNWVTYKNISVNFKLAQNVKEPIGSRIKKQRRQRSKSKSGGTDDDSTQEDSQDGLTLALDIDSKQQIITRFYACFDDDLTVYIVDKRRAFKQIRANLAQLLRDSINSDEGKTFVPTKLFTQNLATTYKVLNAAFGLDEPLMRKYFEWHAFDVAWWMINNCPNRGLNNCNSSLSLVANTKWVPNYRHFFYTNLSGRYDQVSAEVRSPREISRLKDVVKSGKTAVLKPLINEILFELDKRNQTRAYVVCEIPARLTIAEMMLHGIGLDMKFLKNELELYDDIMHQLTNIAQKYYAKSSISLTDVKHVARVLYDDLDLKKHLHNQSLISDLSKDPTNGEVLKILSKHHPFPKLVQDFRKICKALEGLQSVASHACFDTDLSMMRVFGKCDFWQVTGRVSMIDPDLFLINRNFTVTIPAHGNRPDESILCVPRKCFIPVVSWDLIAADYSQLELRLLAHFSNDSNLLEILNRSLDSGETFDVFKTVASRIYQVPPDEVTSDNRQHAKQICYGIIYGMGNRSLAAQLNVDIQRAQEFREGFFSAFPGIRDYTEESVKTCEEMGYVESLLGRRRTISRIDSENSFVRAKAERVAVNTRIQSSASDIIKLAMQKVNQNILRNFHGNSRLVLEMHDELIYEVNPSVSTRFSNSLKSIMEGISLSEGLKVKLLVNLKKGTNWSNLETFNPET